ncbi:hypothetical protein ACFPRL_28230 [Pseudoclavibacter helvolus]
MCSTGMRRNHLIRRNVERISPATPAWATGGSAGFPTAAGFGEACGIRCPWMSELLRALDCDDPRSGTRGSAGPHWRPHPQPRSFASQTRAVHRR